MGATPSPELVGKSLLWIMLITITTVIFISAILYFRYTYNTNIQRVVLGEIYVFDAFSKYKRTMLFAVIGLTIVALALHYQIG